MTTHICKLCGAPVELVDMIPTADGMEETWRHVIASDHAPIPVPIDDPGACDFCGFPLGGQAWNYGCEPFAIEYLGDVHASADEWAACRSCHRSIEGDDWATVRAKALGNLGQVYGEVSGELEGMLDAMHAGFRAHRQSHPPRLMNTLMDQGGS